MRLLANGNCACLSPDKLCHIQVTFGEALLPNACAQYPRGLGIVGGQREMWGSLSCPEMARQCLLVEDGMALATIDAEPFSRPLERRALANPERPYDSQLDAVRTAVLAALSMRQFSMAFRLVLLASLGERTRDFFHRDAATVDGARLEAELSRPRTIEGHAAAQATLRSLRVPAAVEADVVKGIAALGEDRELQPLVSKVLASLAPEAGGLWTGYRERRARWEQGFADRLDLAFEAHAKSYWLQEWYVTSADLHAHLHAYLCQAVIVRFLLFAHPDLLAASSSPDLDRRRGALDRALVEVVSRVTRAVEHNRALVQEIQAAFAAGTAQGFEHVAVLAIA
jgi:lysine-N-methylase